MASYRTKHRADGTAVTHVQIRKRGFPPLTATFARKSDARAWVQQVENRMRERRFFPGFEAQQHTAAEMIDRFVQEVLPNRPKQRRDLTSHLAWWRTEIGRYLLSELW
jgi:hypothetical protein